MSALLCPFEVPGGMGQRLALRHARDAGHPADPQVAAWLEQRGEDWLRLCYLVGASRDVMQPLSGRQQIFAFVAGNTPASAAGAASREEPEGAGSVEMRWAAEHATQLEKYRGEWVLIVGAGLAAHSRDFEDIRRAIAGRGVDSPFVYYVPTPEEANFVAI